MLPVSEPFNCECNLCSLCGQCSTGQKSNWSCDDMNRCGFIRDKIFYNGKNCLCNNGGRDPDCIYMHNGGKVIAIEIKDSDLNTVFKRESDPDHKDFQAIENKMLNAYTCAQSTGLTLTNFILQVSSIKNSYKSQCQLAFIYATWLQSIGFKLKGRHYRNSNGIISEIIKCMDYDNENYFNELIGV